MKVFVELEDGEAHSRVNVSAAYYYPGKGWRVRADYRYGQLSFDSVEGQGVSLDVALQELKAAWIKSWWYTGAPAPKIEAP